MVPKTCLGKYLVPNKVHAKGQVDSSFLTLPYQNLAINDTKIIHPTETLDLGKINAWMLGLKKE